MPLIAIATHVTVKDGKADEFLAAFAPLLQQVEKEPGTLLYAVHRARDNPRVFWTTEVYADEAAFAAHRASEVLAVLGPVFADLTDTAAVTIGETVIARGLG